MEQLQSGYTLDLCPGAFPLSTDSIALADFVKLPQAARVLDLGSGCGTLGLLLCARDPGCTVTGIEITESAHHTALENSRRNNLTPRLNSICGDVRNITALVRAGSYHCCVANPPYFSAGPASAVGAARREDLCSLDALFYGAAWSLRYGGDFFLVHRPERLAELFASAAKVRLEPKRLRLLRHRQGGDITLVLVQFRKGAKPGLKWEELCLFDENEQPTDDYRRLYHM